MTASVKNTLNAEKLATRKSHTILAEGLIRKKWRILIVAQHFMKGKSRSLNVAQKFLVNFKNISFDDDDDDDDNDDDDDDDDLIMAMSVNEDASIVNR